MMMENVTVRVKKGLLFLPLKF